MTDAPRLVVGIDLGGTATRFVAVDGRGQVAERLIASTPSLGTQGEISRFLAEGVRRVTAGAEPASIGVGASGPISPRGIILNPDTLPAFTGLDVPALLATEFGVSCVIDNDAVTAALAEARYGAGRDDDSLLMVTLGTGIGVSMVRAGMPVRGADGEHPEAGHMTISGSPAACYCGRETCWEQAASRLALQRACTAITPQPTDSSADIDAVVARADAGEEEALRAFAEFGTRLADGLANLLTVFRPRVLVLGGSGAAYLEYFRGTVQGTLDSIVDTYPSVDIRAAQFGEFGGAIGAAALAE